MSSQSEPYIPAGTRALIMSKLYYGVLSKSLHQLDIERYFSVLYFLSLYNGCSQQCICNNLAIDKTAMVKVIDALSQSGHIEKKVNPNDRREHFVMLTKKGSRDARVIASSFQLIDEQIFNNITAAERATFNKVLGRLTLNLKEMPADNLFFNYKVSGKSKKIKQEI